MRGFYKMPLLLEVLKRQKLVKINFAAGNLFEMQKLKVNILKLKGVLNFSALVQFFSVQSIFLFLLNRADLFIVQRPDKLLLVGTI